MKWVWGVGLVFPEQAVLKVGKEQEDCPLDPCLELSPDACLHDEVLEVAPLDSISKQS